MIKLDLLDVMSNADLRAELFVNLDGREVPVKQVDSTPDKLVFHIEFDFGQPVFTELTDDEVNAALSGDEDEGFTERGATPPYNPVREDGKLTPEEQAFLDMQTRIL